MTTRVTWALRTDRDAKGEPCKPIYFGGMGRGATVEVAWRGNASRSTTIECARERRDHFNGFGKRWRVVKLTKRFPPDPHKWNALGERCTVCSASRTLPFRGDRCPRGRE